MLDLVCHFFVIFLLAGLSFWQVFFLCPDYSLSSPVAVPEEAEQAGACGGRSEAGTQALLQSPRNLQGGVQGHPPEICSKGRGPDL